MKALKTYGLFVLKLLLVFLPMYFGLILLLSNISIKKIPVIYRTNDYYQWPGGDTFYKLKRVNEQFEVLILGSSKAYRGLNCEILSEKIGPTLNLGTTAQDICGSFDLLKLYYSQIKPKLVLIELSAVSFESDGYECKSNLLANGIDFSYILSSKSYQDIRFDNTFFASIFRVNNTSLYEKEGYQDCGSVMSNQRLVAGLGNVNRSEFIVQKEQVNCFTSLLKWLQQNEISVCFVSLPFPQEINRLEHIEFKEFINKTSTFKAFEYIDLNTLAELRTEEHFYDHIHLNASGAYITTNELINRIKESKLK